MANTDQPRDGETMGDEGSTTWGGPARRVCRVGSCFLVFEGIERLAPMLPWWANFLVFVAAMVALEYGYTGAIKP